MEQIKKSSAAELKIIRRLFLSVYREFSNINEYYKGDLENLRTLLNGIDEIKEHPGTLDKIQQRQLQWFSMNLNEAINRLDQ